MSKRSAKLSFMQDTSDNHLTEDALWAGVFETYTILAIADGAPQRIRPIKSMQPMLSKYAKAFGDHVTPSGVASRLFCQTTATLASKSISLAEIVNQANQKLAQELISIYGDLSCEAVLKQEPHLSILSQDERYLRMILPATTYTVARVNWPLGTLEIAHGADSALIAIYKDGSAKQLTPDQMVQHDKKVKEVLLNIPEAKAEHPFFQIQHNSRAREINQFNGLYHNYLDAKGNIDKEVGVSVINGLPQLMDYMFEVNVPIDNLKALLLITDGVFLPSEGETSIQKMCDYVMQYGLEAYIAFLRSEEKRIRDVGINPFQGHDDASAILLSFSK